MEDYFDFRLTQIKESKPLMSKLPPHPYRIHMHTLTKKCYFTLIGKFPGRKPDRFPENSNFGKILDDFPGFVNKGEITFFGKGVQVKSVRVRW